MHPLVQTLKKMVMQSAFYRRYGHGVVAVEADHFKVSRMLVLVWLLLCS